MLSTPCWAASTALSLCAAAAIAPASRASSRFTPSADLARLLDEYGLEAEDGSIILSREIYSSGRSTARINGRAVPTSVLQDIGQALVDIHGQSEHLSLLRQSEHVDCWTATPVRRPGAAQVAEQVATLRAVRRELQSLLADEREIARRVDLLRYQIDEIAAAALQRGRGRRPTARADTAGQCRKAGGADGNGLPGALRGRRRPAFGH